MYAGTSQPVAAKSRMTAAGQLLTASSTASRCDSGGEPSRTTTTACSSSWPKTAGAVSAHVPEPMHRLVSTVTFMGQLHVRSTVGERPNTARHHEPRQYVRPMKEAKDVW